MEEMTFVEEDLGIALRPVLMKDFPLTVGGETENTDFYIWFAAAIDKDSWFAFQLTDDPDPDVALAQSDPAELRMVSVFMGAPWERIMSGCPHCIADAQRDRYNDTSAEDIKDIVETDIERLEWLRNMGEFEAHAERFNSLSGCKLSLN